MNEVIRYLTQATERASESAKDARATKDESNYSYHIGRATAFAVATQIVLNNVCCHDSYSRPTGETFGPDESWFICSKCGQRYVGDSEY